MKIEDVAKALGQSPSTIRAGLQLGVYPFGTAFKQPGHKTWTYTLYPKKVAEYIGIYGEDEDEKILHTQE